MATYKVSFLNSTGGVVGEKVFNALSNFDAVKVAEQLANVAQCAGFELSNKQRTITRQVLDAPELPLRRRSRF
jgi:hypothetical protein